jgi:ElaB/YqjD/DUF883 family membrane-anchored ribosome-binding protein
MDQQTDVGVMREQIEETRSSLTEKLETLEAEVKETVESARETVRETISSVTGTVHDATETVKRNLDLEYQIHQHPWAMLGLSLLSGVALGAFLGGRMSPGRRAARGMSEGSVEPPERARSAPAAPRSRPAHEEPKRPGFMDKLTSQIGDEVEKAQDLAIATLVGVVRNVAKKSIPALGSAVEGMMTQAASQCADPPRQHVGRRPEPAGSPTY